MATVPNGGNKCRKEKITAGRACSGLQSILAVKTRAKTGLVVAHDANE